MILLTNRNGEFGESSGESSYSSARNADEMPKVGAKGQEASIKEEAKPVKSEEKTESSSAEAPADKETKPAKTEKEEVEDLDDLPF